MTHADLKYWTALDAASACISALDKNGLSIWPTTDPAEIMDAIESVGKPYLTPWLDPLKNDFSANNYFWLIAAKKGQPAIVGGGRLDIVSSDSSQFVHRMFERAYGNEAISSVSSEISNKLDGRICYLGDLYSKSGLGLARSNRRYFLGVANYIASSHLRADYTYSFMRPVDVRRGSADTNGLDRRIYEPFTWETVPKGRAKDEVLVYRKTSSDISYFDEIKRELASREAISIDRLDGSPPVVLDGSCSRALVLGA